MKKSVLKRRREARMPVSKIEETPAPVTVTAKAIVAEKDGKITNFKSKADAARFLLPEEEQKNKSLVSKMTKSITTAINEKIEFEGFIWKNA